MKFSDFLIIYTLSFVVAAAQTPVTYYPKPIFPDDPKGLGLPPGEPRAVDTNGNVIWIDKNYTTTQYRHAALKLVINEANQVAKELQLPEKLPITESNYITAFVGSFGFNYLNGVIGNVTTANYTYYMSVGNKFSYLDDMHLEEYCHEYQTAYMWPISRMDTNQAYQLATQYLARVSMDVAGLNRDCRLIVEPYGYFPSPGGKFVPIYLVAWVRHDLQYGATASVIIFTPANKLLSLRVEDSRYILRKPLIFTNLNSLLPGPGLIITNHPSPMIPVRLPAG